jgi:small subunit ribosomal protein S2
MAPYIHSKRQDSHIIDLTKTVEALDAALPELTKIAASGKKVLFVGTKKQAKDVVKEAAEKIGQPYVTERWIGGMLTNLQTITAADQEAEKPRKAHGFRRPRKALFEA